MDRVKLSQKWHKIFQSKGLSALLVAIRENIAQADEEKLLEQIAALRYLAIFRLSGAERRLLEKALQEEYLPASAILPPELLALQQEIQTLKIQEQQSQERLEQIQEWQSLEATYQQLQAEVTTLKSQWEALTKND